MVIYVPWLFTGGFTVSQHLIFIHTKYRGDTTLLVHERVHQAQMRRVGTATFWWRYLTIQAFRQASEVEAYKLQIDYGLPIARAIELLCKDYRIGMSTEYASKLLKGSP